MLWSQATYVFDNAGAEAKTRFEALSSIFDPGTTRRLHALGVDSGWHCLEVGAGHGSIAKWLGGRVGLGGRVVASDIDTRFLANLNSANLDIVEHNIETDALPERAFDLVHARLVLMHLPHRELALDRMVRALKPGGWILLEEFDALSLLPDPALNPFEVKLRAAAALRRVMVEHGVELRFGRLLHGHLRMRGLLTVRAQGEMFAFEGGSAGSTLIRASYDQLKDAILATGLLSEQELKEEIECLENEDFLVPSPILWAAWGQAL